MKRDRDGGRRHKSDAHRQEQHYHYYDGCYGNEKLTKEVYDAVVYHFGLVRYGEDGYV